MVQDWVDTEYAKIQPWWDRKMAPAERVQRWDEFVKELYRQELDTWDQPKDEQAIDKKDIEDQIPSDRVAFAKRILLRLQDADSKVKMNIHLNRMVITQKETKAGWGND